MYTCKSHAFIYVVKAKFHLCYCRFFLEVGTFALLDAMIASQNKSSYVTEVFIMLIMHSNHRGMPCIYWRVQSLPAQGLSLLEQVISTQNRCFHLTDLKFDAFTVKEKMPVWCE